MSTYEDSRQFMLDDHLIAAGQWEEEAIATALLEQARSQYVECAEEIAQLEQQRDMFGVDARERYTLDMMIAKLAEQRAELDQLWGFEK